MFHYIRIAVFVCALSASHSAIAEEGATYHIMNGAQLAPGHGMAVWDSENRNDWVSKGLRHHVANYPGYDFGGVSVVFGMVGANPPPLKSMSEFVGLSVDLRGAEGGEQVEIGVKDAAHAPGLGARWSFTLTNQTQTYDIDLAGRRELNLDQVELPFILVFVGGPPRTVEFGNIYYHSENENK